MYMGKFSPYVPSTLSTTRISHILTPEKKLLHIQDFEGYLDSANYVSGICEV